MLDDLAGQLHEPALGIAMLGNKQSVESVADADDFPAQFGRGEDCAGDDGVQPGT